MRGAMTIRRMHLILTTCLLLCAVLVACGTTPTDTATPAATDVPATPTAAPAATAPSPAASRYADLPQSRTPEGYHMLGDANAPVAMVMYSDFL